MSPAGDGLNGMERLLARLPEVAVKSMEQALEVGLEAARRRMTHGGGGPQVRTGRLKRSLKATVRRQGELIIGELTADAPYAAAQENGAVIQAKRRDHLRFRVEGRWVSARRVVLPARPFLRPGMEAAAAALGDILAANLEKELA